MKKYIKISLIFSIFIFFISGCVKEEFDTVPEYEVDFEANTSIEELKAMYSGSNILIDSSIIIKGVIVADDETGNFYKELFFQDTSGAISIRLDETDLFNKFPIGQLIYVKCEGLYLGTYQNVFQIGWGLNVDRIPSAYMGDNDVPDISVGGELTEAKLLTINELNDDDIGKLIKLENVQFQNPDQTYADAVNHIDENRILEDCNGRQVDVRTSGYAVFAADSLPKNNGTFLGILSKFNGDYQFKIRSVDEIDFSNSRCTK